MSLRVEQSKFALDIVSFLTWATSQGYEYTLGEVQRPVEMQEIYVRTGRSKTMNSLHLKKCAADIFFFKSGKLLTTKEEVQALGNHWESMRASNEWGGNWSSFKDIPHFQKNITP